MSSLFLEYNKKGDWNKPNTIYSFSYRTTLVVSLDTRSRTNIVCEEDDDTCDIKKLIATSDCPSGNSKDAWFWIKTSNLEKHKLFLLPF